MEQWVLDGHKFLTEEEIKRLKRSCQQPRDLLIIKLALYAGLRVKEVADLKCGDISLETEPSSLTVRHGKGGKSRLVRFNGELKESIMQYLKQKYHPLPNPLPSEGEGRVRGENEPLLNSNNGNHLSKRTIQRVFERASKRAGISGHSFHHLRHTYASHLYRASNYNLRLVQKQLGHSSIKTTQVYADVFDEDLKKALEKLYQ